ncbi:activating signal cointegrator 1 complex subunit 3-like [Gordionus sp. m RMFG-2023]|uniref:activating signal cointegrator 1 complex subunit 3-like n=1 Tax=Gordionus sp. m RMFG-2023 TaxID=3053472 RepID=UPI0031FC8D26
MFEFEIDELGLLIYDQTKLLPNIFGSNIRFENFIIKNIHESSDSSDEDIGFSLKYKTNKTQTNISGENDIDKIYTKMINCLNKDNVGIKHIRELLLNLLNSRKNENELQTEILDLLGYNQFELVIDIFKFKPQLLTLLKDEIYEDIDINDINIPLEPLPTKSKIRHPPIAPQVIVQSTFEINMQKQIEKVAKKLAKKKNYDKNYDTFNEYNLIQEKQEILNEANQQPLFSITTQDSVYGTSSEKLPYVWDSLSEAKETSSFISGNKLNLPDGSKRIQNKFFEEITIPAENRDEDFSHIKIPISSLDLIGKLAFSGVKSLNPVQSIVLDAAYYSHHNLLVCAPTGSGKTNIALLTILNLIKQYSQMENDYIPEKADENDTIDPAKISNLVANLEKDKFKIIYVAPMKALAAEMVVNFSTKLAPFGLKVRELTGDMQLNKREILETQMIVTTPEKWDIITRKNTGDVALIQLVKLLIIDEVHLLQDNRGPVIEAIVARTLRQVETMQSMIRIIGLSATLPSYLHVAQFLRVNPYKGLFFFDGRFRPVPLTQSFIGVKNVGNSTFEQRKEMDHICFEEVVKRLNRGLQIMVFVHARNATLKTAINLREIASRTNKLHLFSPSYNDQNSSEHSTVLNVNNDDNERARARKNAGKLISNLHFKEKRLRELVEVGLGFHHAGLMRSDRNTIEKCFSDGLVKVLVCTSTLAWGVNLPAHCVMIKGTEIYDSQAGGFKDLSILDVTQIFGRAGRPQFYTAKTSNNTVNESPNPMEEMKEIKHKGPSSRNKFASDGGEAILLTTHDKLSHFITALIRKSPIESRFSDYLCDNLNAEIALGTVSNIDEAVEWLAYTYFHVRMKANPLAYGINYEQLRVDPDLRQHEKNIIMFAANQLDKARMIRYDTTNGYLYSTDVGRVASHFYVNFETVELFNQYLDPNVTEARILSLVSKSSEFSQIKLREEEMDELTTLSSQACPLPIMINDNFMSRPLPNTSFQDSGVGIEGSEFAKTNILIQAYISREKLDSFSLVSDTNYISQNICRIIRALFEIVLRKGWPVAAGRLLNLAKVVDLRCWSFESSLRQFSVLNQVILEKLEDKRLTIDKLRDMEATEIGHMVQNIKMGPTIQQLAMNFPLLQMDAILQPITRSILRIRINITPDFIWNDKIHDTSESWWIWIEDPENNHIYHHEYFTLTKKQVLNSARANYNAEEIIGKNLSNKFNSSAMHSCLTFTIPLFEPMPPQYYIRAVSDKWIGSENILPVSFRSLILPEHHPPQTDLLDLNPLPVTALDNPYLEVLYNFTHFNPIQSQVFHCMYHTDYNALIGAPTGSGKTNIAELAIFRLWREYPGHKAVYIAPLKALVKERVKDWSVRFAKIPKKCLSCQTFELDTRKFNEFPSTSSTSLEEDCIKIVELTGDHTPDVRSIASADLIITTPEKWDGISRNWQTRNYVKRVNLIVIDEIHMLGNSRGPVLEALVSRTNYISSHTHMPVRIVGLSTALANPNDLANWLGIEKVGLFNFRPSVRPVPLEAHISGFPGKHYCPRMATMNKPTYQAIKTYSPTKPTIIFVSSRRQTRLTAVDLVAYLALEPNPKQWLKMADIEMENIATTIKDSHLAHFLLFGIGMHHAGLHEKDRKIVEELFVSQKILVLIATSTLAWGVNYPAHLVVIKGTEYFDGKTHKYVDFPITDVLQMMGRAGRPQYDEQGVAVILVQDSKKHFYKKFLYEPFPVESNLLEVLPDHINAEIVSGTIQNKQEALDYLTWTYFFRRLWKNPSFYGLEDMETNCANLYLSSLVEKTVLELENSFCLSVQEDSRTLEPTTLGRIASFYYLSHMSIKVFKDKLSSNSCSIELLLTVISSAAEYNELPVRHNEDALNAELSDCVPYKVDPFTFDSPHTKANLLMQCHFGRIKLPSSDYYTDTKSMLDQIFRILQALLDMAAEEGWLAVSLLLVNFMQMCAQSRWVEDSSLTTLPFINSDHLHFFENVTLNGKIIDIVNIPQLVIYCQDERVNLKNILTDTHYFTNPKIDDIFSALMRFPMIKIDISLYFQESTAQSIFINLQRKTRLSADEWPNVFSDQELAMTVKLTRINKNKKKGSKAYCPKFPKEKDESWVLILAESEKTELVALKRVGCVYDVLQTTLLFTTPSKPGRFIYTFYLMSDSYIGLDQQYDICLNILLPTNK